MFMANPHKGCHEIDDLLFDDGSADSRGPPVDEVGQRSVGDGDPSDWIASFRDLDLDFADNGPRQGLAEPDITAQAGADFDVPEGPVRTVPAPVSFEQEPGLVPLESSDERDGPVATGNDRRRRRVWALVVLALAVAIGGILGAVALTWTDGPRRVAHTGSEVTTTTATTISAAATGFAPEMSAPA